MRIILKKVEHLFEDILKKNNINLKEFSVKINFSYSSLKKYKRGELAMPEELFNKIIEYSTNKEYWLNAAERKEENWGSIVGGRIGGRRNNMEYVRSFRKIPKLKIRLNKVFCEFYGALLGDGCISKFKDWEGTERYVIYITGNKKLDSKYLKYLKRIIEEEFNIYVQYYEYKNRNVTVLAIKNKNLALQLNKDFEVPIGLKYKGLKISSRIRELPWETKKYVIRGLFDTDGCTLANKREKYKYPWVIITSKSKSFLEEIRAILQEQDYPAYNNKKDVCVRGIKNLDRWFKDIGSSNSRNLLKYEYFLKHKFLPARLLN